MESEILRDATIDALHNRSALARSLDESRLELERRLTMKSHAPGETREIVMRAHMILDVRRATAAGAASRR